ncbi:hypothetical protein Tco_1296484, partial [Tanacetum coccineum]
KEVRLDPDAPILVPYEINGKKIRLTEEQIQAHMDKEEHIKKVAKEAKMFEMTKIKVIKVVQEEAEKIGLYPKTIINAKEGEKFKKAQDVEHQVLKREHSQNVTELDELGPIIQKKKNTIVKDLMVSLGKGYERLKMIPKELGIQSTLPAPILEQAPSQSSGRKRKHIESEPEIKVHRLECNRSLPEGVPFVNNMVIEEPEYGIFFIDVFVMASMIKTLENDRFSLKLKKLIAEHPNQEKLRSKKEKLEAIGYKLD